MHINKIVRNGIIVGMASVFWPSVIDIKPIDTGSDNDSQNIADDWKNVGSYIFESYESCTKTK